MHNDDTPTACPPWCRSALMSDHPVGPRRNHMKDAGSWDTPVGDLSMVLLREDRDGMAGKTVVRLFLAERGQPAQKVDIPAAGAELIGHALSQMRPVSRRFFAESLLRAGLEARTLR